MRSFCNECTRIRQVIDDLSKQRFEIGVENSFIDWRSLEAHFGEVSALKVPMPSLLEESAVASFYWKI